MGRVAFSFSERRCKSNTFFFTTQEIGRFFCSPHEINRKWPFRDSQITQFFLNTNLTNNTNAVGIARSCSSSNVLLRERFSSAVGEAGANMLKKSESEAAMPKVSREVALEQCSLERTTFVGCRRSRCQHTKKVRERSGNSRTLELLPFSDLSAYLTATFWVVLRPSGSVTRTM